MRRCCIKFVVKGVVVKSLAIEIRGEKD